METIQHVFRNPWVRAITWLSLLALGAACAYLLRSILFALFFAFAVAYAVNPVVQFLEARGIRRSLAIACIMFALLGTLVTLPLVVVPSMIGQAEDLIRLQAQPGESGGFLARIGEKLPLRDLLEAIDLLSGETPTESAETPPDVPEPTLEEVRTLLAERIGRLVRQHALDFIRSFGSDAAAVGAQAGASALGIVSAVGNTLAGLAMFLGNLVLFAMVTIYLLKDYEDIVASARDLIPPRYLPQVGRVVRQIDRQLHAFMRGQLMVCLFLGLMYAAGFLVCSVPFGLPLALFGGLASLVPYLGLLLTIGPAVLLTLLAHGLDWHLAGVLLTFGLAQFLEGNVLTPRIVGAQVGLGPVWVILAVLVFGSVFGFAGLLLAVPIAAVIKVLLGEALDLYRGSAFFTAVAAAPLPAPAAAVVTAPEKSSTGKRKSPKDRKARK
jgi:predicted PurR-regulated permease PerM